MKKYGNIHGNSGVIAYETGTDFIRICFQGNETYLYNEIKPGKAKVDQMKLLAEKGQGLSTFISQYVKNQYYKKGS